MIRNLTLKFGSGTGTSLSLTPGAMTIFVGPNGSGKSLALRELQQYIEKGPSTQCKIIERILLDFPDQQEARRLIDSRSVTTQDHNLRPGEIRLLKHSPVGRVQLFVMDVKRLLADIDKAFQEQQQAIDSLLPEHLLSHFANLFTVAMDGRNRLALTDDRPAGDLQGYSQNHLAALFKDDPARKEVRDILADAFGTFFTIDPTNLSHLRIGMASRAPADTQEEQALDQRARDYHGAAAHIDQLSDGVKAFTGIMTALVSTDFRIIMIDEPEAFLHPPLARKLGFRTTSLAAARGANVFVATHSADFLMGAVEAGKALNIVRLTYDAGRASARLLPATQLATLMRDPLLRSVNVLSALFHAGAVVCEADVDRSFYQEVNLRLLARDDGGVRNALFLQAQNKQTVRRIVGPLRRMGIAAAAVVDFDIIKGTDLRDLLDACGVPNEFFTP